MIFAISPLVWTPSPPLQTAKKARFSFLTIAKQKKPRLRKLKAAVRKQLNYLQRNLEAIDALIAAGASLSALKQHWWQKRLACSELARQQAILLESNSRSIPHRFAHLVQKQVRGQLFEEKQGQPFEFGAKISITVENGFPFFIASVGMHTTKVEISLLRQKNTKRIMVATQSGSALIVSTSIARIGTSA